MYRNTAILNAFLEKKEGKYLEAVKTLRPDREIPTKIFGVRDLPEEYCPKLGTFVGVVVGHEDFYFYPNEAEEYEGNCLLLTAHKINRKSEYVMNFFVLFVEEGNVEKAYIFAGG